MKFKYLLNYLNERFPFINMMLFVILYAMVFIVSEMVLVGNPHSYSFHAIGIVSVISFFFRLRVFDELKDFKIDAINHPHRVLQSGIINLSTLKFLAFLGFLLELFWVFKAGTPAIFTWLFALIYSLLMRVEFFIPKLLQKNLLVYAITHMLIMPLIIVWIWASRYNVFQINLVLIYLLLLGLLSGFAFEIARKTHAPDAERDTVDSYSKQLGLKNAQYLIIALVFGLSLSLMLLFQLLVVPIYLYFIISIFSIWIFIEYYKTIMNPSEIAFRKNEKKVSLMMLISYLSLILLHFI